MDPVLGKDVILQFMKNDQYYDYGCATSVSIQFKLETKQVRTYGDGTWAKPRGQRHSYTVSLSGLVSVTDDTATNAFDILEYLRSMSGMQYRMFFTNSTGDFKLIEGVMLPVDATLGGGVEGYANGDFSFEGDGNVSIRNAIVNCPSTITSIELSDDQTKILITGHTGEPVRYDYSIDGGGLDTAFIFTDPAEIPLPEGITVGDHDIVIIPVCENGDNGTEFSGTFEIVEIIPPETCDPPTGLTVVDITETEGTAQWTAPGDPPALGYQVEVVDTATNGSVYSSSVGTMGTSLLIDELLSGTEYKVRVRSKCAEDSFSSWVEYTFSTESDASGEATFDWSFLEIGGANGSLLIEGETAGQYVLVTANDDGTEIITPIEQITVRVTGVAATERFLVITDETGESIALYSNHGAFNLEYVFTPIAGHLYSILARVEP